MSTLYWFRNDLRLEDNPALQEALESGNDLVPVFVFDERWWQNDSWGFQKTGAFRTQFLLESVADLQRQLKAIGSNLLIRKGHTTAVFQELIEAYDCNAIFAQKEHTSEEITLEEEVAGLLPAGALHLVEGFTLSNLSKLPFAISELPDQFTQFRKAVEKQGEWRPLAEKVLSIPSADIPESTMPVMADFNQRRPGLDLRAALEFKGGSSEARKRLDHYFWDTKRLGVYKKTRNGLIGADYSSKFSPWLANGSISARAIVKEIHKYEEEHGANESTYWLIFELLWRDYFRLVSMKYGNAVFQEKGIKHEEKQWSKDLSLFGTWLEGKTNDAFVNANMRELTKTGWMSNRGRQNVASYLVHDLNIDWRMGAAAFEHFLLDYDPCSNYGNWMYVAGVGNDPRPNRKFNTNRQADMYDPKGAYQQLWNNEMLEFDL